MNGTTADPQRASTPKPSTLHLGEGYVRPEVIAEAFGVSLATLATWRCRSKRDGTLVGPRWFKRPGGRMVLYSAAECRAYFLGEPLFADETATRSAA